MQTLSAQESLITFATSHSTRLKGEWIMQRVRKGGFRKRLREQQKEKDAQNTNSVLGFQLVLRWCWGYMSLPTVQLLAEAAVADGLSQTLLG